MDITFFIAPIIFGIIFITIFVTVIVRVIRRAKSIGKFTKSIEDTIVDNFNQAKAEAEESRDPYITCDYCGSTNEKTNKSCINCGASLKINKKNKHQ